MRIAHNSYRNTACDDFRRNKGINEEECGGNNIINKVKFNRIMIAGTGSGCGKTTITCGILKALINRGLKVASFKSGPDYIDPMFHSNITGAKSRNLDMFLCGENAVKQLFAENSQGMDVSVVEGVMGFYDGLGIDNIDYSSNDISNRTNTSVVLVVNCKGMALSVAAFIKGFLEFSENKIKAVILNGISQRMYPMYKDLIEKHNGVKVLGFIPNIPEASIESRHLGLVTVEEIDDLRRKVDILADNVERYIDLDILMNIASSAPELSYKSYIPKSIGYTRIGIALDKAFCFYYEDNIELLQKLGVEIVPFSPLKDKRLPEDIDGIIIGGGYPELYTKELSKNTTMIDCIKSSIEKGMPIYAECGGFMYLGTTIEGVNMIDVLDVNSVLTDRLQNFGYIKLTAKHDNLLCEKGDSINAHEFHYSKSDKDGDSFTVIKASSGEKRQSIFTKENIFAGYPHLHLWGNIKLAENLVKRCIEYRRFLHKNR